VAKESCTYHKINNIKINFDGGYWFCSNWNQEVNAYFKLWFSMIYGTPGSLAGYQREEIKQWNQQSCRQSAGLAPVQNGNKVAPATKQSNEIIKQASGCTKDEGRRSLRGTPKLDKCGWHKDQNDGQWETGQRSHGVGKSLRFFKGPPLLCWIIKGSLRASFDSAHDLRLPP